MSITRNAALVAYGLRKGLTQSYADIFNRMVKIDFDVTDALKPETK